MILPIQDHFDMTAEPAADGIIQLANDFPVATREQWLTLVHKAIKGGDFEKRMVSKTADGIRIEPLYTRSDALPGLDCATPGTAPYTRGGSRPSINDRGWDIRQLQTATDPKLANGAILEDLEGGANSIALHMAHPKVAGLPIDAGALDAALTGVLFDLCPVALIAWDRAPEAADALVWVWEKHKIPEAKRLGHFNFDPLTTLAMFGSLPVPLEASLAEAAKLASRAQSAPGVTALIADGNAYHCAGASEAQELAATLSTFLTYLRACEAAGLAPEKAIPKIAVALSASADQFLTIAKLRAARRLLWRVADAAGAGFSAAQVHITGVTSWPMMSKRDPWTNILRTTVATAGAALGGANAILTLPFTYALGVPDRFARRVARNIQIVLQEECNLGRVIDPTGGSWYVEKLTSELAQAAWMKFQEIEAEGGMGKALASGFIQDKIAAVAEARAKAFATGKLKLTGVSAFPLLGDDGIKVSPHPTPAPEPLTKAVEVRPLQVARFAEPFEALRDAADAHAARTMKPFRVFLASIGDVIDHTVRTTWTKNYLAVGGIEALTSDGYPKAEAAAKAFKASGTNAACICSSDALYAEHAAPTAKALKSAGAKLVLMAGRPGEKEAALKSAGVDQFLVEGADAVATLKALQARLAE